MNAEEGLPHSRVPRPEPGERTRPVFVVGCARSGTTLLQLMLHSHPRIAIPPETRFLLPAYERRRSFGDLGDPAARGRLADFVTGRRTRFAELGLDADEVRRRVLAAPGTLGSGLGAVLMAYADQHGKARWGDKRPAYALHVGVLRRLFPDAQFLHLVRDGRDCVASLQRMPWWHGDVPEAAATWAQTLDVTRGLHGSLPPGTLHELRYEDLTADPERELRRVCAFLGEDYDPAMCEPAAAARVAVPDRKTWHERTHGAVDTTRVGAWRGRLSPEDAALCERVLCSELTRHGYELSGAGRPRTGHVLRYRRVRALRTAARAKRLVRDRALRRWEPAPVAFRGPAEPERALSGV